MKEDPIVKEVRQARQTHAKKFNYDLDAIFSDIKRSEEKLKSEGWKFSTPASRKRKPAKAA